jgi:outer membrane lipoprotein-sorting protein
MLQIAMGTKSQSTVDAIKAIDEDIDNIAKEPFTEADVKRAKDDILSAFVFRLDSPDKILAERMVYEYYGYPPDWLDKYQAEIKKITAADVNRVAAKYMHKDQLAVLVVGNTKEFDKPMSSLGSVKEIDITIPPPAGMKQEQSEKPAASNAEGKELASKVIAAMGGEAKFAAIKAIQAELTMTRKTPQGDMQMQMHTTIVYPDRLHAELQTPQGAMTIVATPDTGFMSMAGMGTRPMPPAQKNETLEQIKRDPIFIAAHWKDPDVFFQAGGTEKVGDIESRIVDVNAAGAAIRWFVNPADGHILKETYSTLGPTGPVQGETTMENWKTVNGLTLPLQRKNKQNGEETSQTEYTKIDINPSVDPKLFEKPADKAPAQ